MRGRRREAYYHMEKAKLAEMVGGKRGWFDCAEKKLKEQRGKEEECMISFGRVALLAVC